MSHTHRRSTRLSDVPLKKSCSVAIEAHEGLRGLVGLVVLSVPLVSKLRCWDLQRPVEAFQRILITMWAISGGFLFCFLLPGTTT